MKNKTNSHKPARSTTAKIPSVLFDGHAVLTERWSYAMTGVPLMTFDCNLRVTGTPVIRISDFLALRFWIYEYENTGTQ